MKKKYLSLLIAITSVSLLVTACGGKDNTEPVTDDIAVEEASEAEKVNEPEEQETEEAEPEEVQPEIIEVEYDFVENSQNGSFDSFYRFSEDLAWVAYDKDGETMYGVIDKEGNLVFDINPIELFENSNINEIRVTPFVSGKAAIYCEDEGLVIVDKTGNQLVNEIGEGRIFTGYTCDGEFFYAVHSTGFSEDSWKVNKMKADGNCVEFALETDNARLYESYVTASSGTESNTSANIYKVAEGVYVKDKAIINENINKIIGFYQVDDYMNTTVARFAVGNGYYFPSYDDIAAIDSDNAASEVINSSNYSSLSEYVWNRSYLGVGYSYALESTDSNDNYCIIDVEGNKLMTLPKEVGGKIENYYDCDGKNFAAIAKGADDNYYAVMIDESGEMVYEPVKVGERRSFGYFIIVNGCLLLQMDGEDIIISPTGEILDNSDLSVLGSDAYYVRDYLRFWKNYGIVPKIAEGFIYYGGSNTLRSLDGKTEITCIKAEVLYEESKDTAANEDDSDELSEALASFKGYYSDEEDMNYINIEKDYIILGLNGSNYECIDNFSDIDVGKNKIEIPFDDGNVATFTLIKDDKYELSFGDNGDETYHFYAN